jgi:hypothetical protein
MATLNPMTQSSQFQPRQILCLEHGQSRLYAEVIQVVDDRPVCWLRPLILEVAPPSCADEEVYEAAYQADKATDKPTDKTSETCAIDNPSSADHSQNPQHLLLPPGNSDLAPLFDNYASENYQRQQTREPQPKTYDLRLSSDLLMPPVLFRPAFDTELIPLLGQINSSEFNLAEAQTAHHLLRDFIQQVWQNNREVFPS